ncbi:DEAD/DEAH box helicase [Desulfocurvus sp. DL9XJH121]
MTFDQFDLIPALREGVSKAGYTEPTPIQAKALPHTLAGKDLLGLAQTGTGKTAAFVLPALQRLSEGPRGRLRALVVAPTRELAEQIADEFKTLGQETDLRTVCIYGGVGKNPQIKALKRGAEIAVACPGRLLDLMSEGNAKLGDLDVLVLDEADRMFDMGFLPDVRRILRAAPKGRQTMLFSATMPQDIRKLADEALNSPVEVKIDFAKPVETVAHALYPVPQHLKTQLLKHVLAGTRTGSVLVFTRTKHRAKRLAQQLERMGHKAACLQGNLSQNRRQEALSGFKAGRYDIMVATDIAARGIDVASVTHVINLDIPNTVDDYTHRIGRTGRAQRNGEALTFVTDEDAATVRAIERAMGEKLRRVTLGDFDYNAPAKLDDNAPRQPRGPRNAGKSPAPRKDGAAPRQGRGQRGGGAQAAGQDGEAKRPSRRRGGRGRGNASQAQPGNRA